MGDDVEVSIAQPDADTGGYITLPEVPRNEGAAVVAGERRVDDDRSDPLQAGNLAIGRRPVGRSGGAGIRRHAVAKRRYLADPHAGAGAGTCFGKLVPRFGYVRVTKEVEENYLAWRDAAKTIELSMFGLGQTHRQARYYRIRQRESEDTVVAKTRLAENRYARRPSAYTSYTFDKWLEETGDKYAKKWIYEAELAAESAATCKVRAEYLENALDAKRNEVGAAEAVASVLEAKYESVIRMMYLR